MHAHGARQVFGDAWPGAFGRGTALGRVSTAESAVASVDRARGLAVARTPAKTARLAALPFVREVAQEGNALAIVVDGGEDYRAHLSREIVAAGANDNYAGRVVRFVVETSTGFSQGWTRHEREGV